MGNLLLCNKHRKRKSERERESERETVKGRVKTKRQSIVWHIFYL